MLLLALTDNRAGLAAPNLSQQNTHETAEGKPVLTAKQWMRQTEGQEIALWAMYTLLGGTRVAMAKIKTAGIGNGTQLLVVQAIP
jgi:hypothetical protein